MNKLAALFLLLAITVPASAQMGRAGYTGFSFIAPAEISVGRDDNFLVDRTPVDEKLLVLSLGAGVLPDATGIFPTPVSDTVLLLRPPMAAFLASSKRKELNIQYQPELEIFTFNHDQNSWNTNAEINYTQYLTRRIMFYAGDAYRTSKDPSRTLANPLLLLPRSQYRENSLRAAISFQQSQRTDYTIRYDNTAMSFGEVDPLQRNLLDSLSSGLSFMYSRLVKRNHRLRVTYSVFSTTPWTHQSVGEDHVATQFVGFNKPAQSLIGEYRFMINPKTVLEFSGGGLRTALGTNALFSIFGDRRVGDIWFGGGFSRSLSFLGVGHVPLPNGLDSSSFYDVATFHMRGQPKRNIGIQFNITGSRTVNGSIIDSNKTLVARSRVDYRLSPRTVGFITAETYFQNRNNFVPMPISRHRLFVGLDYSFASEQQQRTTKLNRDADNVALTDHARLKTAPDQE
jgi:hypothetical protein